MTPFFLKHFPLALVAMFPLSSSLAKEPAKGAVATEMASAAKTFLDGLDATQREAATFPWENGDAREDWHYIPKERDGLYISKMTPAQRDAAHALLRSAMSTRGFEQVKDVMALEQVLRDAGGDPAVRDPEKYAVSIFGDPAAGTAWGWRFEGHHLSVNITIAGGEVVSVTPSFFGTNPAEVREGPKKGMRVLGEDEDAGRALANALVKGNFSGVLFSESAPDEIVTGAERVVRPLEPVGVAAGKLPENLQDSLRNVIDHYVRRYRETVADADMAAIEAAGFENVHFGWAGGLKLGEPCYFRIQGPTFIMEYVNTQNDANHAHAVWRDFEGDFGRDVLREHLENH